MLDPIWCQFSRAGDTHEVTLLLRHAPHLAQRTAAHPLGRQDLAGGTLVDDAGHLEHRVVLQQAVEAGPSRTFADVVALVLELTLGDSNGVLQVQTLGKHSASAEEK